MKFVGTKISKINYKKIFVIALIGLGICLYSDVYAEMALSKIDVIPREGRGADDSLRIYTPKPKSNIYTPQKLPTALQIKQNIAEKYLLANFASEFKVDKVVKKDSMGRLLKRPLEYKNNKKKIVIHHTAGEVNPNISLDQEAQEIRNIYKFHSNTRDRGDIGYNYIIGPSGKIYEGRYGGSEVVGAHVKRNNTDSIGISLLGNFDIQEPTQAQLDSLINLITAVSEDYNINPYTNVVYHKFNSGFPEPYIKNIDLDSIVGHGDVGDTSCPGANIKKRMGWIKEEVYKRLNKNNINNINHYKDLIELKYEGKKLIIPGSNFVSKVKLSDIKGDMKGLNGSCKSTNTDVNCNVVGDYLHISIKEKSNIKDGTDIILGTDSKKDYILFIPIYYVDNVDDMVSKLKQMYPTAENITQYKKVGTHIDTKQTEKGSTQEMSILLHGLTLLHNDLDINCTNTCIVVAKEGTKSIKSEGKHINTSRTNSSGVISYNVGNQANLIADEMIIQDSNGGDVIVNNYDRKSPTGIAWNRFGGKLIIKPDYMKIRGVDQRRVVYINQLPFDDYMAGIANADDSMEQEEVNTIYLIAKNYAIFYLYGNKQDDISAKGSYTLVDNPQMGQKYVGAGFKNTSKKRNQAISMLHDKYVYYNDDIAILPYFECSAGFTQNAIDKFGWTDTPYINSVLDIYGVCKGADKFKGDGVGIPLVGVKTLATMGYTHKDIINYYYNDVNIR